MTGAALGKSFDWYSDSTPGACPPRSLFVVFTCLLLGISIPALILWIMGYYSALQVFGVVFVGLVACLLLDVLLIYRRYKVWSSHWVCGSCKSVFEYEQKASFGTRWTVS